MIPATSARRVPYPWPTGAPYNVPTPAVTPTYDGTGQAVHPSVLDFHQITGSDWNGWRYWMAMTPYPQGLPPYENPSILVSRDGFTWQEPQYGMNPIYPEPSALWNSDTHFAYDEVTDELVMAYRGEGLRTRVARSADGVMWPVEATLLSLDSAGGEELSPCLLRVGTGWELYTLGLGSRLLIRRTSTDLVTWTAHEAIDLGITEPWHLDVHYLDGVYYATIDRGPIHLTTDDGLRAATSLDGVTWTVAESDFLSLDFDSPWEAKQLYRSCIQPHEDGVNFRLWYSATGSGGSWWTMFTQVPRSLWPTPPAP